MTTQIVITQDLLNPDHNRRKFDIEIVQTVLKGIADGLNITDACYIAGISRETYRRWIHQEPTFVEMVAVAEAEYKRDKLEKIAAAGKNTNYWSANAWLLERKYPGEYGKRTEMDITSGGQPIKAFIGFTPDEWDSADVVDGEVIDEQ